MDHAPEPRAAQACCAPKQEIDPVAEAGEESFPASDPPAWTAGPSDAPVQPDGCCCSRPKA